MERCPVAPARYEDIRVQLYSFPGAPSPMRVELMLKYKGVSVPTEIVDIRAAAQFTAAYRSINPRCTVPALVLDDGSCLSEVIAICLYLDSRFPEKSVFGASEIERAHVINWMHRIFNEGFVPAAEALRNTSESLRNRALPGPDDVEQIPALAERGRRRLPTFFETIDRALADRAFLVGDQLSQADIDAWVAIYFAKWSKVTPPASLARLAAWRSRVASLAGQPSG